MKKIKMVSLSALVVLGLVGCSESDVATGGSGNSVEEKKEAAVPKEDSGKRIDATNQKVEAAGLKVGLGEIKIEADKISVGINIENTSDQAVSFYPDQGQMVIGDMQLSSNFMMNDGDVDSETQPGVKKEAVYVYPAPKGKTLDVDSIKEIKLFYGDVTTADYMTAEPVNFTVGIK